MKSVTIMLGPDYPAGVAVCDETKTISVIIKGSQDVFRIEAEKYCQDHPLTDDARSIVESGPNYFTFTVSKLKVSRMVKLFPEEYRPTELCPWLLGLLMAAVRAGLEVPAWLDPVETQ